MADRDFKNDGVPEITRYEHDRKNVGTKKVDLWAYLPDSDEKVRITAIENGDGTYSLLTFGGGMFTKAYDEVILSYTDATKATLSTVVSKLNSTTQETITYTEPTTSSERYVRT